jgi:catechol 2,3-dioxygenase
MGSANATHCRTSPLLSVDRYLRDPDGNGIELAWDRPETEWPLTDDGRLLMDTHPLNTNELLRELTTNKV